MPRLKEPKLMRELHKIRAELGVEWQKMSARQIIASLRSSGERLKSRLAPFVKNTA